MDETLEIACVVGRIWKRSVLSIIPEKIEETLCRAARDRRELLRGC